MSAHVWGSDTPVSIPTPKNPREAVTDLGDGWGFGQYGLVHNLSLADWEELVVPNYSPPSKPGADPYGS